MLRLRGQLAAAAAAQAAAASNAQNNPHQPQLPPGPASLSCVPQPATPGSSPNSGQFRYRIIHIIE